MRLLARFLLRQSIPILVASLFFFVLIIQLVDLFANLVRFLNLDVPLTEVARAQLLFMPRAIAYALPVAILFAVGYTFGSLYANNELIAVFGSGIPLWRFALPLLVVGMSLSVGLFFFSEYVVIDTYRAKNELTRQLLNIQRTFSNTNVTVRGPGGLVIYNADYYNDSDQQLSRVLIIERDNNGAFVRRIDAAAGEWNGEFWVWRNGIEYRLIADDGDRIEPRSFGTIEDPLFDLRPRSFQRVARDIEEMRFTDARDWITTLRNAGQPYQDALVDYYNRYSLALTPFIVTLLSSALGGRFRKNILLMSLLVSLIAAVVYYVVGMVAGILASDGLLPPFVGSWLGVILFSVLGIALFRRAKT